MSHQTNYDGPEALKVPLDFLSRFIRGFCLWPIVAGVSMIIGAPFIVHLVHMDSQGQRATGLALTFLVICIWSPGLAMAICFAQRHQPRLWGPGRWLWRFDPDDLPFPFTPKPENNAHPKPQPTPEPKNKPGVPDLYVPDPDWFDTPAPAELREKEMDR